MIEKIIDIKTTDNINCFIVSKIKVFTVVLLKPYLASRKNIEYIENGIPTISEKIINRTPSKIAPITFELVASVAILVNKLNKPPRVINNSKAELANEDTI